MNDDFLKPLDVNVTVGTGTDNLNSKYSVPSWNRVFGVQTPLSDPKHLSLSEDKFEFATKFSLATGRILYGREYYTVNHQDEL